MPVKPPEVVTTKDGLTAGLVDCARESSVCAFADSPRVVIGVMRSQVFRFSHGARHVQPQNQRHDA